MPLVYKIDVLQALKNKGYTTYKIKQEKLLAMGTLQKLRDRKPISWENIEKVCSLLECQPGDIIEYIE